MAEKLSDLERMRNVVSAEIQTAYRNGYSVGTFPISDSETMKFAHRSVYDAHGKSAASIVDCVAKLTGLQISSIMDFPCGHGRVMRALRANWPNARIVACDIDKRGVDFCARTFSAEPLISQRDLDKVSLSQPVDLVWIGSLLTHLDVADWERVFAFTERALRDGGVMIATYAGPYVAELIRNGDHDHITDSGAAKALKDFDDHGFGFAPYSSQNLEYGRTLTSYSWMSSFLSARKIFRPVLHFERGWAGRQSVIAAIKEPLFSAIR